MRSYRCGYELAVGAFLLMDVCVSVCVHIGPTVTELVLLVALKAEGLSEALQDAVAGAIGDAAVIPLAQVKDLLVGAGVGLAAAKRIVGQLVRCAAAATHSCMLRGGFTTGIHVACAVASD